MTLPLKMLNLMAVKLQLGNAGLEAPASSLAKLELGNQCGGNSRKQSFFIYPLKRD